MELKVTYLNGVKCFSDTTEESKSCSSEFLRQNRISRKLFHKNEDKYIEKNKLENKSPQAKSQQNTHSSVSLIKMEDLISDYSVGFKENLTPNKHKSIMKSLRKCEKSTGSIQFSTKKVNFLVGENIEKIEIKLIQSGSEYQNNCKASQIGSIDRKILYKYTKMAKQRVIERNKKPNIAIFQLLKMADQNLKEIKLRTEQTLQRISSGTAI